MRQLLGSGDLRVGKRSQDNEREKLPETEGLVQAHEAPCKIDFSPLLDYGIPRAVCTFLSLEIVFSSVSAPH
jgi:hypothetical protein